MAEQIGNKPLISSGLIFCLDPYNLTKGYRDGQGSEAYDLTRRLINITGFNAVTYGTTYTFDGVNDYMSIPLTTAGNSGRSITGGLGSFTIELWVNPVVTTGNRPIFSLWNDTRKEFLIRFLNGDLQFFINTNTSNGTTTQTSIPANRWHHIVAIYDGSQGRTYVNGVQSPTTFSITGTVPKNNDSYWLGRTFFSSVNSYYQGQVGTIRAYNRVLSDHEIRYNYNTLRGRYGI